MPKLIHHQPIPGIHIGSSAWDSSCCRVAKLETFLLEGIIITLLNAQTVPVRVFLEFCCGRRLTLHSKPIKTGVEQNIFLDIFWLKS